jgi:signal transduction histidine kinase
VNDHRQCDWNAPDPDWQPLPSLGRLVAFGIVDADLESGHEWVRPDRAAWLEAAITEPPTALAALVRATLDDRTAQVVGSSQGAPAAVRELAETVAHELGNVVGAMDLTLRALAPDLPAGDRRLARLVGSTAKLQRFAQSLRELLPTGYEPPAPHGLLSIVMDCLDETEAERNGHLRVQLRVDEVLLVVPRRRLVLALVQLVRNAAQAVATRPGLLVVSTAIHADRVELWFEDDGPGVPPAVEGRIWERGVSGRGGSGLGLALVRDVVERELLGSVTHEHRAPTGARFVLSLPFAAETP